MMVSNSYAREREHVCDGEGAQDTSYDGAGGAGQSREADTEGGHAQEQEATMHLAEKDENPVWRLSLCEMGGYVTHAVHSVDSTFDDCAFCICECACRSRYAPASNDMHLTMAHSEHESASHTIVIMDEILRDKQPRTSGDYQSRLVAAATSPAQARERRHPAAPRVAGTQRGRYAWQGQRMADTHGKLTKSAGIRSTTTSTSWECWTQSAMPHPAETTTATYGCTRSSAPSRETHGTSESPRGTPPSTATIAR